MSSPENKINDFYYEESAGVRKNRRMIGITTQHKNRDAVVYFYIKGVGSPELGKRFKNKIRRIIEGRVLDEALLHCDFAETISDEKRRYYEIVEWWTSHRLRQAILQFGRVIRRAMRIKITENYQKKYEFHVLVDSWN